MQQFLRIKEYYTFDAEIVWRAFKFRKTFHSLHIFNLGGSWNVMELYKTIIETFMKVPRYVKNRTIWLHIGGWGFLQLYGYRIRKLNYPIDAMASGKMYNK